MSSLREAWQSFSGMDYPHQQQEENTIAQTTTTAAGQTIEGSDLFLALQDLIADSEAYLQKKINQLNESNTQQCQNHRCYFIVIIAMLSVLLLIVVVFFIIFWGWKSKAVGGNMLSWENILPK